MGTTADKLNKLLETKAAIKQAIIDKGVDISDTDTFASYPEKIESIQAGGDSVNWLDIISNNGTTGDYLFYKCKNLDKFDLTKLDTSEMTNMLYMFAMTSGVKELDLKHFDTSNVTSMTYMFSLMMNVEQIDVSSFDTRNVTSLSYMFYNCVKLKSINVSHFNTDNVTTISSVFYKCELLTSLDCGTWNLSKITSSVGINDAFNYCYALVDFYPPQNIGQNMKVDNSTALSHDSLVRIINNLMEVTTTKTLTLGTTNLAKLSDEEKAVATNKGWTLK